LFQFGNNFSLGISRQLLVTNQEVRYRIADGKSTDILFSDKFNTPEDERIR